MTEERKRKISYALRGRKKGATTRHLISIAMKNKPKTEAHKKAISEGMKLRKKIKY